MEEKALEALSAFADGEPVETARLLDALTRPGAHQALIDFVQLRDAVEQTEPWPRPGFVREIEERLVDGQVPWWRRMVLLPAPALAAILALFLVTLGWMTRLATVPGHPLDAPPVPSRVLHFEAGVEWAPAPPGAR